MVELRKRPAPKEPPAPAPAAKKGRASSSKAKDKPAASESSVTAKAKKAATKVKQAVAGPTATETNTNTGTGTTDNGAAKQPTIEDVPETAVESGQTGMIPETAGTAPSTTTVPATTEPGSADTATAASVSDIASAAAAKKPGAAAASKPGVPISENLVGQSAEDSQANLEQAQKVGLLDQGATSDTAARAAGDADRPPATEDLENPPETGKVEPAATTSTSVTVAATSGGPALETATVPLSAAGVGKQIPDLSAFGGTVETHMGTKTTLAALLTDSPGGVVIFTYPRASTPGCTTQACSFRDNHATFTDGTGLKVYGLSTDSTKANTTFATKQKLPYELLCDVNASLTGVLGMKKGPKSTVRGVVVIDGKGVIKVWFQGGPQKTVDVVEEYVGTLEK
ncbi:thioredoxin peroxidase dot5 [Neophaeococcomyces mojaviensis]|uniref:Thioredoxin peroxidase dot5 n=1 Tax=Neophaeococcomyces mojaviensis TaxID=3383035 RepID=A0ACC2ZSX8_9EURO|nr:thioredoxin peroxidase dot5 [Knufia sp. JES_112]